MLKQVLVLRTDLGIGKGKLAAQASHAAVKAVLKSNSKLVEKWDSEGAKKIVVKVNSEKELLKLYKKASKAKLVSVLISDAGLTQLKPGTKTAVGIGPDDEKKIDKITGKLKLL
ncbi:MAG: peptidyl-tRNA hydrolase Pth2 [Candidatus Nanoarchaeia archaeon]